MRQKQPWTAGPLAETRVQPPFPSKPPHVVHVSGAPHPPLVLVVAAQGGPEQVVTGNSQLGSQLPALSVTSDDEISVPEVQSITQSDVGSDAV
jgi:hypothetical protein